MSVLERLVITTCVSLLVAQLQGIASDSTSSRDEDLHGDAAALGSSRRSAVALAAADSGGQRQEKAINASEVVPGTLDAQTDLPLSQAALEVAKDLDIISNLDRLQSLKRKYLDLPGESQHIDMLACRQDIDERMLTAFLETHDTIATLDSEIAQNDALADILEAKRDKSIRNNNVFNFSSQGGLAMFSSGLQVGTGSSNALQNTGNTFEVISGGLQTLVSSYALKIQNGRKRTAARSPNMLAPVLGRDQVDYSNYPPSVWAFLNNVPPAGVHTRRETLVRHWIQGERIDPPNKRGSALKLDQLSGTIELQKAVTIDLLRARIPMLEDIRATVSTMSRSLREIMDFVRKR